MKKLLILLPLCIALLGCATTNQATTNTYQQVVESDKSQQELFKLSNEWIAINFESAKSVIEYSDNESGKIMGHGRMNAAAGSSHMLFDLTIEVKDNKSRITYTNIEMDFSNLSGLARGVAESQGLTQKDYDYFVEKADLLNKDYLEYVNKTETDW